jgi:hypothetical protein
MFHATVGHVPLKNVPLCIINDILMLGFDSL